VTIPACGHNVHSGNTPAFLAEVTTFLAEVAPG
jgi:pimeloyl-ACP methyl ester carboxylesterase